MGFTNNLREDLLDEVFGGQNFVPPANLYVGLSTTLPNDTGTGITEPLALDGYARVLVVNNLTNWNAAIGGLKDNAVNFEFPEATGAWGTITHFFIATAATGTGSVVVAWGTLTASKVVSSGDTARFQAGDLDIQLS